MSDNIRARLVKETNDTDILMCIDVPVRPIDGLLNLLPEYLRFGWFVPQNKEIPIVIHETNKIYVVLELDDVS